MGHPSWLDDGVLELCGATSRTTNARRRARDRRGGIQAPLATVLVQRVRNSYMTMSNPCIDVYGHNYMNYITIIHDDQTVNSMDYSILYI